MCQRLKVSTRTIAHVAVETSQCLTGVSAECILCVQSINLMIFFHKVLDLLCMYIRATGETKEAYMGMCINKVTEPVLHK